MWGIVGGDEGEISILVEWWYEFKIIWYIFVVCFEEYWFVDIEKDSFLLWGVEYRYVLLKFWVKLNFFDILVMKNMGFLVF